MAKGLKPKQVELDVESANNEVENAMPIANKTVKEIAELFDGICTLKDKAAGLYNTFGNMGKETALRKLWLAKRWFIHECEAISVPVPNKHKTGKVDIGLLSEAQQTAETFVDEINQLLTSPYFSGENKARFPKTIEALTEAGFSLELYAEEIEKLIKG